MDALKQAFLFPGQASQAVGMGRDLYERYPSVRGRFEEADDCLSLPLTKLCFEGPLEDLCQTAVTQPAVYVHSVAVAEVLAASGIRPDCVAGHSLGEYSALAAAGVFDFSRGLELVRDRGRLMQEAGEQQPGAMAAIVGLDDEEVAGLCAEADSDNSVVAANFNAPGQVVVSGTKAAVARLSELAAAADAKRVVALQVSGAFHSKLMQSAADKMAALLEATTLNKPRVPVVSNVTAEPTDDPDELRRQLLRQMVSPVRWTECVRAIVSSGVAAALEVGPGAVLRGLARRIDRGLAVAPAGTVEDVDSLTACGNADRRAQ